MNMKKILNNRKLKYGSLSTAVTLVVIAAIVVLTVILSMVSGFLNLRLDTSPQQLFKISDEALDYVKSIDTEIDIIFLEKESNVEGGHLIIQQTNEMLKQMKNVNSKIKLSYVDIASNPAITSKYGSDPEEFKASGIIVANVASPTRYKYVSVNDLAVTEMDYQTYQENLVAIKSEEALTSALLSVTTKKLPKVEVVSGHAEADAAALTKVLTQNNYAFSPLNLLEKDIAADTDYLLIYNPQADFAEEELKKLDAFMLNGEKMGKNIFFCFDTQLFAMPRLEAFLKEWGIEVDIHATFENDENYRMNTEISQYPLSKAVVNNTALSAGFKQNMNVLYLQNRNIKALWETSGDKATEVMLQTSGKNYMIPLDNPEWEPASNEETFTGGILVKSTQTKYIDGTTPASSTVLVCGSPTLFEVMDYLPLNTQRMSVNLFNEPLGLEAPFTIVEKPLASPQMNVTEGTTIFLAIVTILLIPVGLIVWGIIVWLRRKSL